MTSLMTDKIERVKIGDLVLYPKNPRVGNIEIIAESLVKNGQFQPLIVQRSTGQVLAGNHTMKAAASLKWKTLDVVYIDVDDEAAKKIVLAANRTSDLASYDTEVLTEILASLPDPIGTGYDDGAVRALMAGMQDHDAELIQNVVRPPVRVDFEGSDEQEWDLDANIKAQQDRHDAKFGDQGTQDISNGVDIEKMRVAESIAAMQIQFEQWSQKLWESSNFWGVPDLRPDMLMDVLPDPLGTWGGQDATPDDGVTTYLWNAGLAATKGMPWDRTITTFFCVDEATEALTQRGWLSFDQITEDDTILSMDPADGGLKWSAIHSVFRKHYDGKMYRLTGSAMDALVTPGHKFATTDGRLVPVEDLMAVDRMQTMGTAVQDGSNAYSDAFVELVGWAVTEGSYRLGTARTVPYASEAHGAVCICQNPGVYADRIETCLKILGAKYNVTKNGTCLGFNVTGDVAAKIIAVSPNRVLDMNFIAGISPFQRDLLIETMIDGDGWRPGDGQARQYGQKDAAHTDAFVALCAMAGIPTSRTLREWKTQVNGYEYDCVAHIVTLKIRKVAAVNNLDWHGGRGDGRKSQAHEPTEDYAGTVWCPSTEFGTWVCRRNGKVYVTGNTYDTKFENWFDQPAYEVAKMIHNGCTRAIVPDTSFWLDDTRFHHLAAQYNAQWLARFMQECGVKMIPRFMWCDLDSIKVGLLGLPKKPPIAAVCIQAISRKETTQQMTAEGLRIYVKEIEPQALIVYGGGTAQKVVEEAHLPKQLHVVMVENYSGVRRNVVYDNPQGKLLVDKEARKKAKAAKTEAKSGEDESRPVPITR